jgi:hypothetical protein
MKEALAEYSFQGSKLAYMAIAACIILVLKFGVFPAQLIHAVKKAALF